MRVKITLVAQSTEFPRLSSHKADKHHVCFQVNENKTSIFVIIVKEEVSTKEYCIVLN
jgi:hypothetical protein